MEVEDQVGGAQSQPRFARYRSMRKAASRDHVAPPMPNVPPLPQQTTEQHVTAQVAPSRYRRPTNKQQNGPAENLAPLQPLKNNVRTKQSYPEPTPEAESQPEQRSPPTQQERKAVRNVAYEQSKPKDPPVTAVANRGGRYRSRTVTKPAEKVQSNRRSYDQAREEARLILEGEYDRLEKLKKQHQASELERKKRAALKLAAQKAAEAEEARVQELARAEAERQRQIEEEQKEQQKQEQRAQSGRKWTIGGSSGHKSPPSSAPQSPPSGQQLRHVRTNTTNSPPQDRHRNPSESECTKPVDVERPTLKQRIRRPTISKSKAVPAFEPKAGDGPPKTAVNGPAATVDAPVSAVNAGERRVEIRCQEARITLPVTPSTTVRDLLNSASVIMSQSIDPRTDILVETYYPLGLERPLRRYEHIRDVMNSWDSDTQNYLMITPPLDQSAGLEQHDAPADQPHKTIVQMHHSQKPGKWEKHWMTLRSDGQVTASSKENDVDAANVFHLSDFDVYTPTKKQLKQIRPPKKICFAIKSQQRSIMFESTENFVHFFTTNDKAIADAWYNAVQAWRSWYLVDVLGQGTAQPPAALALGNPRPSVPNVRDSIPYQLGTFQPLLDFSVDAFTYGEAEAAKPVPQVSRSKTLTSHARKASEMKPERSRTMRHGTGLHSHNPSIQIHAHRPSTASVNQNSDAAFTGKGLLARQFSIRKMAAEENAAFLADTDNAFTGGLLRRTRSVKKAPENPVTVFEGDGFTGGLLARTRSGRRTETVPVENSNDAFTGGLLGVQRIMKKRSMQRPGQPLLDMTGNSNFQDGSLLRQVEGYERDMGLAGPVIDRSRGVEVSMKTGEV